MNITVQQNKMLSVHQRSLKCEAVTLIYCRLLFRLIRTLQMHYTMLVLFFILSFLSLDLVVAQSCVPPCPCFCNNSIELNCSGLGLSNVSTCQDLDDYQTLLFNDNMLTDLRLAIPPGNGCVFNFSGNRITTVQFSAFVTSGCAKYFDLSHNAIERLAENSIDIQLLEGDVVFNMSFNQIQYLEVKAISLEHIVSLRIGQVTIDLSSNQLLSISSTSLVIPIAIRFSLLVSNNAIFNLNISDFVTDHERSYVFNVQANNVSRLLETDIESVNNTADITLLLNGNPWVCDCTQRYVSFASSSFRTFLSKQPLSSQPICEQPQSVRGQYLLSLSRNQFICPPSRDPGVPLGIEVSVGGTIELTCPFVGADPPVKYVNWRGPIITPPFEEHRSMFNFAACVNCSFNIKNAQPDSAGDYECAVSNGDSVLRITQSVMVLAPSSSPTADGNLQCDRGQGQVSLLIILIILLSVVTVSLFFVGFRYYKLRQLQQTDIPFPRIIPSVNVEESTRYDQTQSTYEEETYPVANDISPYSSNYLEVKDNNRQTVTSVVDDDVLVYEVTESPTLYDNYTTQDVVKVVEKSEEASDQSTEGAPTETVKHKTTEPTNPWDKDSASPAVKKFAGEPEKETTEEVPEEVSTE